MGSTGLRLLSAAHGAGSMLGTLIIATAAPADPASGVLMLTAAVCMGLALMMFSRSPGMGFAFPMLALTGFCSTFYLTHVTTIIQQKVPDHLRGRVLSLYSLCWNLLPLGGLLAGGPRRRRRRALRGTGRRRTGRRQRAPAAEPHAA